MHSKLLVRNKVPALHRERFFFCLKKLRKEGRKERKERKRRKKGRKYNGKRKREK